MQDNTFDNTIKNALDHFEVPYDASTWAALEQKMDLLSGAIEPPATDAVDKVVADGIGPMEAPFQSAHWEMLDRRMRIEKMLSRRIVVTKIAEAAIFLLLIWNFGGLLTNFKASEPTKPAKPKYNGPVAEMQKDKSNKGQRSAAATAVAELGNSIADILSAPLAIINEARAAEGFTNETTVLAVSSATNVPSAPIADTQTPNQNKGGWTFNPFNSLPGLPSNGVQTQKGVPQFSTTVVKQKKERHFYVSNYATAARNHIRSPYDAQFDKAGYDQWANGYGAGLTVGSRKGKWGVEGGVAYTSKRYSPRTRIEIYPGLSGQNLQGAYLQQIDLDVVSVPVNVSRQLARMGRTEIRARVGATANVATQAAYRYRSIEIPAASNDPDNPTVLGNRNNQVKGTGILEGGQLDNNAWATMDVGLRLERTFKNGITAFVEPVYSRSIAGKVGPKNDKIGGVALNAGVMANVL